MDVTKKLCSNKRREHSLLYLTFLGLILSFLKFLLKWVLLRIAGRHETFLYDQRLSKCLYVLQLSHILITNKIRYDIRKKVITISTHGACPVILPTYLISVQCVFHIRCDR